MNKRIIFQLIVLFGLILMLLFSCSKIEEKPKNETKYVIEGHLYNDCDMEPVSGLTIELIQDYLNGALLDKGGLLDSSTTDENGYFQFIFKDKEGFDEFIQYKAGWSYNRIIYDIPKKTSFTELDLFLHPSVNLEVCLNVINPYTEMDTLVINDFKSKEGFILPGPFKSGFAFRSENVVLLDMSMDSTYFYVKYLLLPYKGYMPSKRFGITEYCDNTVKITIDIE